MPNGSIWLSGLSETRPRERAVLSPSAQAAAACALVDHDADDDGDGAREQVHDVAAGHGAP